MSSAYFSRKEGNPYRNLTVRKGTGNISRIAYHEFRVPIVNVAILSFKLIFELHSNASFFHPNKDAFL